MSVEKNGRFELEEYMKQGSFRRLYADNCVQIWYDIKNEA